MKTKDIIRLGVPFGKPMDEAFKFISAFCTEGGNKENLGAEISAIVAAPGNFVDDLLRGPLASALQAPDLHMPGKPPAPWKQWGTDIDDMARKQIEAASLLPISVAAALMPDAHVGYGLPIGGVLATENAVIPSTISSLRWFRRLEYGFGRGRRERRKRETGMWRSRRSRTMDGRE